MLALIPNHATIPQIETYAAATANTSIVLAVVNAIKQSDSIRLKAAMIPSLAAIECAR